MGRVRRCRTGGRPSGIGGRKSRGGIGERRRTWEICRIPGWRQNTCLRSAACSPTSGWQIARTLDEHTFGFDIGPGVAAGIELRPPLPGRLLGVRVNGSAHSDFDAQSVLTASTPAEIVCRTTTST